MLGRFCSFLGMKGIIFCGEAVSGTGFGVIFGVGFDIGIVLFLIRLE